MHMHININIININFDSKMSQLREGASQPITILKHKPINSFRTYAPNTTSLQEFCKTRSLSSFETEYAQMATKMKLKINLRKEILHRNKNRFFGTTAVEFPAQKHSVSSFRIRTESSFTNKDTRRFFSDKSMPQAPSKLSFVVIDEQKNSRKVHSRSVDLKQNSPRSKVSASFTSCLSTSINNRVRGSSFTITKKKPKKFVKVFKQSHYSVLNYPNDKLLIQKQKNNNPTQRQQQLEMSESGKKNALQVTQHLEKLLAVYQQLASNRIRPKTIVKSIKVYILEKSQGNKTNPLENLFAVQNDCKQFKQFILLERCALIGILDLVLQEKIEKLALQCKVILTNILGFYRHLINKLMCKESQKFAKVLEIKEIQARICLSATNLYISSKIHSIFRYQNSLYHHKIKPLLASCQKISINRAFYNLLSLFAAHLCDVQLERNDCLPSDFVSLMTCPSPFILAPRKPNYKYSLVLDLDQTLVYTNFAQNSSRASQQHNLQKQAFQKPLKGRRFGSSNVLYRPHCMTFLQNVSQFYEIIIFTSSISEYAEEVVDSFRTYVDHVLSRQHTIKKKGQTLKDLSRIGRGLETVLIIDNLPQNFRLQKENGIQIKSWYGEQEDEELLHLQSLLLEIARREPKDLRKTVQETRTLLDNTEGECGDEKQGGFFNKLIRMFS